MKDGILEVLRTDYKPLSEKCENHTEFRDFLHILK